ncbi:hypothetical protein XA68_14654 [Ophiocordyceps unilateralis]|uniref:Acyl-CoA thioesterase II domain-containing protein n=1 Tax=Ophiocordyceps unilateralis TaxID=268505 RepID=A0A2A9PA70_OPHUN|nr:hypothetical protein XA68_14654 [Ophiocordyceps unilateralis]
MAQKAPPIDAMEVVWPRLGFQEAMAMTPLPAADSSVRRYVSRQPAWKPGGELPWEALFKNLDGPVPRHSGAGAYGGHVFAQAPLAAARAVEGEYGGDVGPGKLGIHTIHGVFTSPGLKDRPFVYDVSPIFSGRSFAARLVNVRQPTQPSEKPQGPFPTPGAEAALGHVCFSCITTFKRSLSTPDDLQESRSVQERFADVLTSRRPEEWEPSPQMDIDLVKELFPRAGAGAFPILDMRKVDMTEYNAGKPVAERIQLIYYRLLEPLPRDDVNAHIVCHAFEADRNGLTMLANHIGYGSNLGKGASLSYSLYVHVNADEAVMDGDGWWLQEVRWPRISAGRCMMESKLWSPEGRHIASGYQDGIVLPGDGQRRGSRL